MMIKKLFFYLMLAVVFTACTNPAETTDVVADENDVLANALSVDNLLDGIDTLVGIEVSVIGTVDHVCKHGGTKMVIYTESPDNGIHINATEESGNFRSDEVMDELVIIQGVVSEFRVDEGYIAEKEAKLEEMIAGGAEVPEETEEAEEGEHHDGGFPDNDEKHKQEIKGLQNQIASLKEQLEEARANGKDHISFYSVKCNTYEIREHEDDDEEIEEHDHDAAGGHDESLEVIEAEADAQEEAK